MNNGLFGLDVTNIYHFSQQIWRWSKVCFSARSK